MKPHGPLRVLIVEDEPRLRDVLCDALPDMGYRPAAARSAEEALRLMRREPADILLLDLNLPGMDGMALLDELREPWPDLPVVILTGYGSLEAAQRAIRHRVVDFLTKPCHMGEIEAVLDRARRQHEATHAPPVEHLAGEAAASSAVDDSSPPRTLEELDRAAIRAALARHEGNRTAAAAELGISRRTLYNRLLRMGDD